MCVYMHAVCLCAIYIYSMYMYMSFVYVICIFLCILPAYHIGLGGHKHETWDHDMCIYILDYIYIHNIYIYNLYMYMYIHWLV